MWRIALYCAMGGLCMAMFAIGHAFVMSWLAGVVLTASFVPVARWGLRHPLAQFAVIFLLLLVVGLVCSISEAVVFLPDSKSHALHDLASGAIEYAVLAAVLAALAKVLNLTLPETPVQKVICRPAWLAIVMVLASGFAYLVYLLVFGAITFLCFTKKYYSNMPQPGAWFLPYELLRGAVMTLAAMPIIYTLRIRRWQAALATGTLLWIVGGGASLLMPNPYMVTAQRYIHIVEILTQNMLLGITAVLLLRRKDEARAL
jgi:hypothetical protein